MGLVHIKNFLWWSDTIKTQDLLNSRQLLNVQKNSYYIKNVCGTLIVILFLFYFIKRTCLNTVSKPNYTEVVHSVQKSIVGFLLNILVRRQKKK